MGWTWRVLRRRSIAQGALLLPVLAVAVVGATLLGTFLLLLTSSEHRALAVGADRTSAASRELDAQYDLARLTEGPAVIAHGSAAVDRLLGPIPAERSAWYSSQVYGVEGTADPRPPYVYYASYPVVADGTRLTSGSMPTAATDADGNVQTAVPRAAADAYGWQVGSVVTVTDVSTRTSSSFVVTGTFEIRGTRSLWARDVLGGQTSDPAYPLLGSTGNATTRAWGPFVVTPDVFTSGKATLERADLVALPHFDRATPAQVAALRDRLGSARAALSAATAADYAGARLVTHLGDTIDQAVGALQVTRVGLVVVGLVLVVLAVTVLLLAARLLAERRAAEQTLMASRGANGRQILGLAALEALAVAVVTTAIAPWLAAALFAGLTATGPFARAGLHHDPGHPWELWVVCGAAAALLAAVLLTPVLRRHGSVVDIEQQLVRQDARGGLARAGVDVALVVLAGLALVQLRSHRSPVLPGVGGVASVDPVLAAAPALVLLGGAVLALRLVPLVARVGERVAARSRTLVGPLAAWEVGRRPARAAGAVLLLTLVVGAGTFAQSFLATWRASQLDQMDLAAGADIRLVPRADTPLEASAALAAVPGVVRAAPVTDRTVTVGTQAGLGTTIQTRLLAVDTTHATDLLRGRTGDGTSWADATEKLAPQELPPGLGLPGAPVALVVAVTSRTSLTLTGTVLVQLVLQDADGGLTTVELPLLPASAPRHDVAVALPVAARGSSIVGYRTSLVPSDDDRKVLATATGELELRLELGDLRAVSQGGIAAGTSGRLSPDALDPAHVTPVPFDGGSARWTAAGIAVQGGSASRPTLQRLDGTLDVADIMGARSAGLGGQGFMVVAAAPSVATPVVPVVATPGTLERTGGELGDILTLDVGGTPVAVDVVGTIDRLPGEPAADGVLADSAALGRATLLGAGTTDLVDEWWLQAPDTVGAAVAQRLTATDVGAATSRVAARADATVGPLHVGTQAALWLVTLAALGLGVVGLALHATVSVRTRRLELARLQAVGASRGAILRSVLVELGVLGALGTVVGLALGGLLAHQVTPLVMVSASGAPPVPDVLVHAAWPAQLRLLALLVVLVGVTVATVVAALLRRASGELLRLGDER